MALWLTIVGEKETFTARYPEMNQVILKRKWLQDTELKTLKVRGTTLSTSCCECIWSGLGLDIIFSVISVSVWPSSVAVCVVHHAHVNMCHMVMGRKPLICVCVCVLLVGVLQMESSLSLCLSVSVCGTVTKPPFTWEQMTGSGFSVPSAKGNKIWKKPNQ